MHMMQVNLRNLFQKTKHPQITKSIIADGVAIIN